jgi:type II secretory ATPase GspE/PulE/Tfp pilus assembly ATPase PilB-like protein/CheY-like chemotaxis protein
MPPARKTLSPADQRLVSFLQRRDDLPAEKIARVAAAAAAEGIPLVEALEEKGVLSETALARRLATELRLPLLNLPTLSIDEATLRLVDESLAARHLVLPVRGDGDVLVLAMANPFDLDAVKVIEFATGRKVRPAVATRTQIRDAIDRYYRFDSNLKELLADVPDASGVAVVGPRKEDAPGDNEKLARAAEEAPIVKMVNLILGEAVKSRASDIHIEAGPNATLVRFRIHGILEDALRLPKWVHSPIVARIKVMARLDITERRVPQDGSIRVRFADRLVDVRVSCLPTNYGEKVVMRVLDPSAGLRRLEEIGLGPRDAEVLRRVIQKPEGMILVTGPTGSGKTTTLYAVLQEIASPDLNIVTIEDPIEYELKGVAQTQINEKQGLTFATALRSILRQDPDVILVGEIRDEETARTAFQAAQTGHLVLSTLHTNDTVATIARLLDLGIEPFLAASSLVAVVAQRLVRTVCSRCAEPAEVDEDTRKRLGLPPKGNYRRGRGCESCRNSGFGGRTGVYEILEVTPKVAAAIEARAPEATIRTAARSAGMRTLLEDAVEKIVAGITTPEEVLRVVQADRAEPECPRCGHPVEETFTVCPYCRHPLQATCSSCKAPLKADWTTCPYCGEEREGVAPAANPPAGTEAPEPRDGVPLSSAGASTVAVARPAASERVIDIPRILVVDDNEDLRKVVKLSLERGPVPMQVETAANGYEALGKVEVHPPHLIILDLMMPGIDGFEVCRRLRANLRTAFIPIVMLTAREDVEAKIEGFRAGTDDYLVKPFNRAELTARVLRLLERTYGYRPPQTAAGEILAVAQAG